MLLAKTPLLMISVIRSSMKSSKQILSRHSLDICLIKDSLGNRDVASRALLRVNPCILVVFAKIYLFCLLKGNVRSLLSYTETCET